MKNTFTLLTILFFLSSMVKSQTNLDSGMVAYYNFNGNANEASVSHLNGSVYNATLTEDRFNNSSKAYYFNGSAYIEVPHDSAFNFGNSMSISLWMKQESAHYRGYRMLDKSPHGSTGGFMFDTYGDITRTWTTGTGRQLRFVSDSFYSSQTDNYALNTWHHMVVTFDQGTVKFYIDGILDATITDPTKTLSVNNLPLLIGTDELKGAQGAYGFKGAMDEIRIYKRALNASEISAIFNITSVGEITQNELLIYPNPSASKKFTFNSSGIEILNAMIYDVQGRLIRSLTEAELSNNKIDLSNEASGIYMLMLDSKQGSRAVKLAAY